MQFSDTVILMILLLVTVALTGGFLYAFIQATNERRRRGEEAARRGWEHRVERNAARLAVHLGGRLSDGTPWRIEIVHLRSGSGGLAGHYTRWWCEDVRLPGAAVVIGPAGEIFASSRGEPLSPADLEWDRPLIRLFVRIALRMTPGLEPDDVEWLSRLQIVEVGGEAFREHYAVLSDDAEAAARIVEGEIESGLLDWARSRRTERSPLVMAWEDGIQILFPGVEVSDIRVLDQVVALGAALARRVRPADEWRSDW